MNKEEKQSGYKSRERIIQERSGEGRNEYFIPLLIILVAFTSFGLGRLSTIEPVKKHPITFEPESSLAAAKTLNNIAPTSVEQKGSLVASKNGAKYHFPWCSGAQRIKEENKIWFDSATKAREAGYAPASNCKGLK